MELTLYRTYYPEGTNGQILSSDKMICESIELPWKDNKSQVSCIPEGRYELRSRYNKKRGWHLYVVQVPKRRLILIHPANNALKELKGCIAPVNATVGNGLGRDSKMATERLRILVYEAFAKGEKAFLTIKRA